MIHHSVLLAEVLENFDLSHRSLIIDATLGLGGHSEAIFSSAVFSGKIIGIDQDNAHLKFASKRLEKFSDRFTAVKMNFSELGSYIESNSISFDAILFDLGVASPHLDDPHRGFSFQSDAELDMRMNTDQELTAAEIINNYSEEDLLKIFREYGEEKFARRIVKKICRERQLKKINTTFQLADLIRGVYHQATHSYAKKHPATKVFQALRIAVNNELEALKKALKDSIKLISPSGRILVISYHSLEDRITKVSFQQFANPCKCPPKLPQCVCGKKPLLRILTSKAIRPSQAEINMNPRARSAKLRVAERI